jgi:alkylation response protein AidB-like acyl-CoA dehydrogenase
MHEEIRKLGSDFSRTALAPEWERLDVHSPALLNDIIEQAAAAGILAFTVPERAGGSGLGPEEFSIFIEEVSRVCPAAAAVFASHFAGIAPLILAQNDNAARILSSITSSEGRGKAALFTPAIRENASRDFIPEHTQTTIEGTSSGFLIRGAKTKAPAGEKAEYFTVLARDENNGSLAWAVVPRASKGIEVSQAAKMLGLKLCAFNEIHFDGVEIPSENIFVVSKAQLLAYHRFIDPVLAAVSIGAAAQARSVAIKYTLDRYQGGTMISEHDVIRDMLLDMEMRLRASRALAYGPDADALGAPFAAAAAEQICLDAIQILGGYGYTEDYRIERFLRDVKTWASTLDSRARGMQYIAAEMENLK